MVAVSDRPGVHFLDCTRQILRYIDPGRVYNWSRNSFGELAILRFEYLAPDNHRWQSPFRLQGFGFFPAFADNLCTLMAGHAIWPSCGMAEMGSYGLSLL